MRRFSSFCVALAALALAGQVNAQVTIAFQGFETNSLESGSGAGDATFNQTIGELTLQQQILELDANGDGVVDAADGTGEITVFDSNNDGTLDAANPVFEFRAPSQYWVPELTDAVPTVYNDDFTEVVTPGVFAGNGTFIDADDPAAPSGTGRVYDATDGSFPWVMRWTNSRLGPDVLDDVIQELETGAEAFVIDNGGPIDTNFTFERNVAVFNEANHFGPVTTSVFDANIFIDEPIFGFTGAPLLDTEGNPIIDDTIPNAVINQTPGFEGTVFDLFEDQLPLGPTSLVINGVSGETDDSFGVVNAELLNGIFGGSFAGEPNFIPEGEQALLIEDSDSAIYIDFEDVDLSGFANPQLRFDVVSNGTGYEENDKVQVIVNPGSDGETFLIDLEGAFALTDQPDAVTGAVDELETASFDEIWDRQFFDLTAFEGQTIDLRFVFDGSAGSEAFGLDDVQILGFDSSASTGDLNADGAIDSADFDLIAEAIAAGLGVVNEQLDLNGDGVVSAADYTTLAGLAGTVVGDVDLDGDVDGVDLSILADTFNLSTISGVDGPLDPLYSDGDLNGDGFVNGLDLSIVSGVFGFSGVASAAAVPEPTAALLTLIASGMLTARRRV